MLGGKLEGRTTLPQWTGPDFGWLRCGCILAEGLGRIRLSRLHSNRLTYGSSMFFLVYCGLSGGFDLF